MDISRLIKSGVEAARDLSAWLKGKGPLHPVAETLEVGVKKADDLMKRQIRYENPVLKRFRADAEMIEVSSKHPDPKVAELGSAFEAMMQKPLVQKFRRHKLKLFLAPTPKNPIQEFIETHTGASIAEYPPVYRAAYEMSALCLRDGGSGALGLRTILLPWEKFKNSSLSRLMVEVGHEVGHHLRGDTHPRQGLASAISHARPDRASEEMADKIGGFLSETPLEIPLGLRESHEKLTRAIESFEIPPVDKEAGFFERRRQKNLRANMEKMKKETPKRMSESYATRDYPSLREREAAARELEARMATPEGKSHVEQELVRELEAEHRRLFPHHYARPGGVTRGE